MSKTTWKLATIIGADVVGYSNLMGSNEEFPPKNLQPEYSQEPWGEGDRKKKFSDSYENVSFEEEIQKLNFKDASIKQTMKELIA